MNQKELYQIKYLIMEFVFKNIFRFIPVVGVAGGAQGTVMPQSDIIPDCFSERYTLVDLASSFPINFLLCAFSTAAVDFLPYSTAALFKLSLAADNLSIGGLV